MEHTTIEAQTAGFWKMLWFSLTAEWGANAAVFFLQELSAKYEVASSKHNFPRGSRYSNVNGLWLLFIYFHLSPSNKWYYIEGKLHEASHLLSKEECVTESHR